MIGTFYSFKGGVGRSMALANVAERMYRDGLRVLMVDFDLEAPGLERYFADVLPDSLSLGALQDKRGVLDMLVSYKELRSLAGPRRSTVVDFKAPLEEQFAQLTVEPLASFIAPIYPQSTGAGSLALMTAGARGEKSLQDFSRNLLSFDWGEFYREWDGELFFEWFRYEAEKISDIVLIDSRTGMTEMGGVCTHQLADVVVSFVAANQQNQQGILRLAKSLSNPELIEKGRRKRKLFQLFVPSRIESSEGTRAPEFQTRLYDALHEIFPDGVPGQEHLDRSRALPFNDVFLPYVPYFAFDEKVAVREANHPFASWITTPIATITATVAGFADPNSTLYLTYHSTSEKLAKVAEEFWQKSAPGVQAELRVLAGRLVRVPLPNETTADSATAVRRDDLDSISGDLVGELVRRTVIKIARGQDLGVELVGLSDPNIVKDWSRLGRWIDEDRPFLAWRQRLSVSLGEWESRDRNASDLLTGASLAEAERWLSVNPEGINRRERDFVEQSVSHFRHSTDAILVDADSVVASLTPSGQESARRVLLRLVSVSGRGEDERRRRRRAPVEEFAAEDRPVLDELQRAGVVVAASAEAGERGGLQLADERLMLQWTWLREQLDSEREFLAWREELRLRLQDWIARNQDDSYLLRGPDLARAKSFIDAKARDFSTDETAFVTASKGTEDERERVEREQARAIRRRWRVRAAAFAAAAVAAIAWWYWTNTDRYQVARAIEEGRQLVTRADLPNAGAWYEALATAGHTDEAIDATIGLRGNPADKVKRLMSLGNLLISRGEKSAAVRVWKEGLSTASMVEDREQRVTLLLNLATVLSTVDRQAAEEALNAFLPAIRDMPWDLRRARLTGLAIPIVAKIKTPQAAEQLANETAAGRNGSLEEVRSLAAIADGFHRAGIEPSRDKYSRLALAVPLVSDFRVDQLAIVAADYPDLRIGPQAIIEVLLGRIGVTSDRLAYFLSVADAFIERQDCNSAVATLEVAEKNAESVTDADLLTRLAVEWARCGRRESAETITARISETAFAGFEVRVARALLDAKRPEDAIRAANRAADQAMKVARDAAQRAQDAEGEARRAQEFTRLPGRPGTAQDARAKATLAADTARTLARESDEVLAEATTILAEAAAPAKALDLVPQIGSDSVRVSSATKVGLLLARSKAATAEAARSLAIAEAAASTITDAAEISKANEGIGRLNASLHYYKRAREVGQLCAPQERLTVLTSVLTDYARRRSESAS